MLLDRHYLTLLSTITYPTKLPATTLMTPPTIGFYFRSYPPALSFDFLLIDNHSRHLALNRFTIFHRTLSESSFFMDASTITLNLRATTLSNQSIGDLQLGDLHGIVAID